MTSTVLESAIRPLGSAAEPSGRTPLVASATGSRRGTVERFALASMTAAFVCQAALHPTGPGNSSPVDVLTLVSVIAAAVWVRSARIPLRAPYVVGAGLMVIGGAIAGATGPMPGVALLSVVQDLVLIVWCTAIVAVARTPHNLSVLARGWAYSAVACAALLVIGSLANITAITGVVAREGNREMLFFGDPNYAATYWVMSLFIVHACQAPRARPWRIGGYALLIGALLLSESNGGAVELLLGCGLLAVLAVLRRRGPAAAIALLLVVGGSVTAGLQLVPLSSLQVWARDSGNSLLVNSLGRSNDSSGQRSQLIGEAMQLYQSEGVLGYGPSVTKPLLQARSYPYAKMAHNDYLAALVERGPLGVLGLIFLVASAGWRGRRVLQAAVRAPTEGPLPRPAGLLAALLTMGVAAGYYQVLHFRFVWGVLALVAAYAWQCADTRSGASAERNAP